MSPRHRNTTLAMLHKAKTQEVTREGSVAQHIPSPGKEPKSSQ